MNKEEWQKLHGILYGCYEEFLLNYNLSKNGRNPKEQSILVCKEHKLI